MRSLDSRKTALMFVVAASLVGSLLLIPDLSGRVGFRLRQTYVNLWHTVNPESSIVPTPVAARTVSPTVLTPVPLNTTPPQSSAAPATGATATSVSRTPVPDNFQLAGFTHVWQKLNNCGPATLAMDLIYWGWKGTQANTAAALKPDPDDRNVSPEEMAAYARSVGLGAEVRVAGSLPLVKQFVSSGFPVILEKGLVLEDAGWEGHYTLVTGYSDATSNLTTQDSLQGPNFQVPYYLIADSWRAFNYLYIVVFPIDREAEVKTILGEDVDATVNYTRAANIARQEAAALGGQAQAFAWFNLGSSLNVLGDTSNAASAFDQARVAQLPWRIVWYQFGPLESYYASGRYDDVVSLANAILAQADNLEEVYYWRGRARLAEGDRDGAISDWRAALRYNRNYSAPQLALAELGLSP